MNTRLRNTVTLGSMVGMTGLFLGTITGCSPLGAQPASVQSPSAQSPSGQPSSAQSSSAQGCHLYIGIDTTASTRQQLGAYALLTSQLAGRLNPDQDTLTLFRVDRATREFYDRPAPSSTEALLHTIVREVKPQSKQWGTFPARFWSELAQRTKKIDEHTDKGMEQCLDQRSNKRSNKRSVIIFFTDGDNDDPTHTSKQLLRQAAAQLAARPELVAVIVCGAEARNWAWLRQCFAPLKQRFHLLSPTEMDLDHLLSTLNDFN